MKPKIKTTCTKLQLHLLSFCLLCLSGKTRCDGNGPAVITVEQGSDAVLPCSLSSKEDIESKLFDWKKAAQKDGRQKEVFYYDAGITYDIGRAGQSEEFKGRVSHFPEELEHGNASIIIRNTKVTDSGNYTCDFPRLQPPQTFHIELVVEPVVVTVEEGRDALLPCSLRTKENISQGYFTWDKVAQNNEKQKEVFQYLKGRHSPSYGSQDDGFKGRVSHFQEELTHGNASIIIRNTKMADSGDYTCVFPEPRQTFYIKLVVEPVVVTVEEGRDAFLPCSLSTKENIEQGYFDWNKVAQNNEEQKEVFQYLKGRHSNTGFGSQDGGFKDRVSHFQEELTHGNASIIIRNTKMADSGDYTCDFLQPRQTFHIKLVVEPVRITVKEDSDALLPCSLSTKENISQGYFDWNKVAQNNEKEKEVFQYDKRRHSNTDFGSQDGGFKGRVSHFQEELEHGNASIIIRNTRVTDSGNYTCTFTEPRQTFHIELVVECALKDRTPEKKRGACPKPNLRILRPTKDGMLLQCVVRGASPKPKVELKDSSGNKLPAKQRQGPDRGGSHDIILQTTVTKTDNYSCISTQEDICHQISADTHVPVNGAASKPNIRTLDETENWRLLQCEANGNPQPEVEWRDSAGNKLPAEEPQVTERDGRFYVTLNTTVTKTDKYRCVATQKNISHQIHDETFVHITEPRVIKVRQDVEIILPCSLSTKKNIESEMFEWKKDGLKEVFFHGGSHYNSSRPGQSEEFKGRVSHFPEELKHGDASITIRNTKMSDSGDYTCDFPRLQPRQISHIKLVVVNSGSGANSSGSTGWTVARVLGGLLFFVIGGVVLAVLIYKGYIPLKCNKGSPADQNEGSALPLKSQPSRSEEAPDPET